MVLYPQPEPHREVTVRRDESVEPAGRLSRETFFIADIQAVGEALASSIADRLFLTEEETEFDYVEHYDSVDAWMSCLNKPRVGELVADERLIESPAPSCREEEARSSLRRGSGPPASDGSAEAFGSGLQQRRRTVRAWIPPRGPSLREVHAPHNVLEAGG